MKKHIKSFNENLNRSIKPILQEVMDIAESDCYGVAISDIFLGDFGPMSAYIAFLNRFFEDSNRFLSLVEDCENVEILRVTATGFEVLVFDDGYEGNVISFELNDNNKLSITNSRRVIEDDNVFEEEGLSEDEIDAILEN